jgi:hypothetical protein
MIAKLVHVSKPSLAGMVGFSRFVWLPASLAA